MRVLGAFVALASVLAHAHSSDSFAVPAEFKGEPTDTDKAILELLEQELAESKNLTNLYKKKLSQLQELRTLYVGGSRGGVTPHALSPLLHMPAEADVKQYMIQRAALTSEKTVTATAVASFIQKISGMCILLPTNDFLAVELLRLLFAGAGSGGRRSKRGKKEPAVAETVNIAVIADSANMIYFYDSAGEEILAIKEEHATTTTTITKLAFETGENNPVMVTSLSNGNLQLYNLTVWAGEKVISGRRPRSTRIEVHDKKTNRSRMKIVKATPPETGASSGIALVVKFENTIGSPACSDDQAGDSGSCSALAPITVRTTAISQIHPLPNFPPTSQLISRIPLFPNTAPGSSAVLEQKEEALGVFAY
jgi:hypothetical protein